MRWAAAPRFPIAVHGEAVWPRRPVPGGAVPEVVCTDRDGRRGVACDGGERVRQQRHHERPWKDLPRGPSRTNLQDESPPNRSSPLRTNSATCSPKHCQTPALRVCKSSAVDPYCLLSAPDGKLLARQDPMGAVPRACGPRAHPTPSDAHSRPANRTAAFSSACIRYGASDGLAPPKGSAPARDRRQPQIGASHGVGASVGFGANHGVGTNDGRAPTMGRA